MIQCIAFAAVPLLLHSLSSTQGGYFGKRRQDGIGKVGGRGESSPHSTRCGMNSSNIGALYL